MLPADVGHRLSPKAPNEPGEAILNAEPDEVPTLDLHDIRILLRPINPIE